MKKIETGLPGIYIIEPQVFGDLRGYFMETYSTATFAAMGIDAIFVQDNQSFTAQKGTLRGIHFQNAPMAQAKLVLVARGAVMDVAVDLRKGSPTYLKWQSVELSEENKRQLFMPKGFAHGFVVLSDEAEFAYKCTDFYHPGDEGGLAWNDETIGVKWPITPDMQLIISEKDQKWPGFKEIFKFDR